MLERGEIKLGFDAERGYFTLNYYEHRLPVDPSGYGMLIRRAVHASSTQTRPTGDAALLLRLAESFDRLPAHHSVDGAACAQRQRDKTLLKASSADTVRKQPAMAVALTALAASMNGQPGKRTSFDALDAADRGPALPPGAMARRRRRDQLPPLLRRQRTGRAAHGA